MVDETALVQAPAVGVAGGRKVAGSSFGFGAVARFVGRCLSFVGLLLAFGLLTLTAHAQSDITSTLATLSGYWTAALAIGVPVLLWVIGRMLVHKGTRG